MKKLALILTLILLSTVAQAEWISFPETRKTRSYGPIITDIEQHLFAGHPYRSNDKVTWAHEGTHGANSVLRNKYGKPGFYVLKNAAYTLNEPRTTLSAVSPKIPRSLRGHIYSLYCVQSRRYWNNQPSYLFDEWIAYTNGTITRNKLQIKGRRETTAYMIEMAIYSTCVPYTTRSNDPEVKEFTRWMWERTMALVDNDSYLTDLKTNNDAVNLRKFMQDYYGSDWTKTTLGF